MRIVDQIKDSKGKQVAADLRKLGEKSISQFLIKIVLRNIQYMIKPNEIDWSMYPVVAGGISLDSL